MKDALRLSKQIEVAIRPGMAARMLNLLITAQLLLARHLFCVEPEGLTAEEDGKTEKCNQQGHGYSSFIVIHARVRRMQLLYRRGKIITQRILFGNS